MSEHKTPQQTSDVPPEKSAREHDSFSAEHKARAEARAVEMALILMQWTSHERALASVGLGIRERIRSANALRDLLGRAEQLTREIAE